MRRRSLRWRTAFAVGFLVLAAGGAARAGDAPPAPDAEDAAVAQALGRLGSGFQAERERGVEDLIGLGVAARRPVLEALRGADAATRPLLVRVLAADGSRESLDALLDLLPRVEDVETVRAIQLSLVEHAEAVGDAVAAWRDPAGKVPPRIAELADLLERARIEALFLSRKSRSGETGSYPGQFEALEPYRKRAVEVCLAIALDRPFKEPGQFPAGSYHYLRPPPFLLDRTEIQHMAVSAIAELATPEDTEVIRDLEKEHARLEEMLQELMQGGRPAFFMGRTEEAMLDALVSTLARLKPRPWRIVALMRAKQLESDGAYDAAAAICLRLGEYGKAERYYRRQRLRGEGRPLASYNLACTYARWSLESEAPSDDDEGDRRSPEELRDAALGAIEDAVASGYADWEWMEQDRDLDAIRKTPRFQALVARLRAKFDLPRSGGSAEEPVAPGMK